MNIGVIGLGLIGGSFVKAYRAAGHSVFVYDIDEPTVKYAHLTDGALPLDENNIGECDLVIVALYPTLVIKYIEDNATLFKKSSVVVDTAGIKRDICEHCFPIAKKNGFTFIGGHPMAGTQYSGYKYAKATLFKNASMLLCPANDEDLFKISEASKILKEAGFSKTVTISPEDHDKIIAFTSQLAHIVSNAYIKSPTARDRKNCSAGSYKDMTRVAWLNEKMWAELFLENKDMISFELDTIINSLKEYKDAIKQDDNEKLVSLLRDGRIAKEEIDG